MAITTLLKNSIPTIAVIPTRFETDSLLRLIDAVKSQVTEVYVLDNGQTDEIRWKVIQKDVILHDAHDMSIYQMWNYGWKWAKRVYKRKFNIAFLNDDIIIDHNTVETLGIWLRTDPELAAVYPDYDASFTALNHEIKYTESTYGHGGMSGFCFMLKGELDIPYVDENLKLYWGDDDLVKQIEKRGLKIGRVIGLPVIHLGSKSINKLPYEERLTIMEKDRQYFNSKYNENRSRVEF